MKKKATYIIFILGILGVIGYFLSSKMMTNSYYNRICGSGLTGMRSFMLHYLPIILIIGITIYVYTRYNSSICKKCKGKIEDDFNTCPFCGTPIEKRG